MAAEERGYRPSVCVCVCSGLQGIRCMMAIAGWQQTCCFGVQPSTSCSTSGCQRGSSGSQGTEEVQTVKPSPST